MFANMLWLFLLIGAMLSSPLYAASFTLNDPGEKIIEYSAYGSFEGVGTDNYKFVVSNSSGLKAAAGEGVFPNTTAILRDPAYKEFKRAGHLNGNQWDFVNTDNVQANFYKWATSSEDPGVRQYYTALALERSGNLAQAIKAYYAVVVHFPKSVGYTYWKTPWYIGPVAIDKIKYLTRMHPELGMHLKGASIRVRNKFDDDKKNDVFIVTPGTLVAETPSEHPAPAADVRELGAAVKTVGTGDVKLVQYANRHWQLLVDGKPYSIRGLAYSPNKVGLSPDEGTLNVSRDWMNADFDRNGTIDGPYEAWVDENRNNRRDAGEQAVGDFQLMKDMGVNTLRIYHYTNLNKALLMDGYRNYGFRYLMGNMLGMYATGSDADWFSGTDYTNPAHRQKMLDDVRAMVEEYKNEPYILMWVLGNENNYGTPGVQGKDKGQGCRAKLQPAEYYRFVNEAAQLIKSLDPQQRPVAVCNGDTLFLDVCAANAPAVDVFGANAYRGEQGFGALWEDVAEVYDRPAMVTEYGCSAYNKYWDAPRSEEGQACYHRGNWMDIDDNRAGGSGTGNALGGVIFEWTDEWWKAGPPPRFNAGRQETVPQFGAPFLDGWSYEEWLGLAGQGDGSKSPFLRQLRPAYFVYKELWNKRQ